MCGIFFYKGYRYNWSELQDSVNKISYRGPDNTHYIKINDEVLFAFHRLAIMGISSSGDQPMKHPHDKSLTLICNGEIYNYKDLAEKYDFNLETGSDCEINLFLYREFGIERTINELDGVFMFVIHDASSNSVYASRDPIGVRPGFIGLSKDEFFIASEANPMIKYCDNISAFPFRTTIVCSKCADGLLSIVVIVHPSLCCKISFTPIFIIGSIAITKPSLNKTPFPLFP